MKIGLRYIIIGFVCLIVGVLSALIMLPLLSPILKLIGFINSGSKWDYDPVALLSVNVGILQSILGIGAIVAALLVFINFNSTKDKLRKVDDKLIEVNNKLKEHDTQIKTYQKQSDDIEQIKD